MSDRPATDWMPAAFEPGLVSVMIPTHNRAHMIGETIQSVWEQDYRPIEVIIVDNGSTDGTARVVEDWKARTGDDPAFTIRYYPQEDAGCPAGRNRAFRESRGEFLQVLDSDDLLSSGKVSSQVRLLRDHPDIDYVYGKTEQIGRGGQVHTVMGAPLDRDRPARSIVRHLWHGNAPLYRRRLCIAAGPYSEDLTMSEDWEYAARIKAQSMSALFQDLVVSRYRIHGNQMVAGPSTNLLQSRKRAIEKVLAILDRQAVADQAARNMCARLFIATALNCGRNSAPLMTELLRSARRAGSPSTRLLAMSLRIVSAVVPPSALRGLLRFARRTTGGSPS